MAKVAVWCLKEPFNIRVRVGDYEAETVGNERLLRPQPTTKQEPLLRGNPSVFVQKEMDEEVVNSLLGVEKEPPEPKPKKKSRKKTSK